MSRKYSSEIPGRDHCYQWPVRFDSERGYLGVTQTTDNDDGPIERVLLSRSQVAALLTFLGAQRIPKKEKI